MSSEQSTENSTARPPEGESPAETEAREANMLAEHLRTHRTLAVELATSSADSIRRAVLENALQTERNAAITIVDRHLRQTLRPMLAGRFRNRGLEWQETGDGEVPDSGDAMVRYTELIGDFFVQVLSKIDDQLWKLHSITQMRSYVATALSRDILDILRRSKRQVDVVGREDESGLDTTLASHAKERFERESEQFQAKTDYESSLRIVLQWEQSRDKDLHELANVFMLYFVAEMTMKEIAADTSLSIPTVSRRLKTAIEKIREELGVTA